MQSSEFPLEHDDSGEGTEGNERDGDELVVESSNQVLECDYTCADILLVDQHGQLLSHPQLTTTIDPYSRCIVVELKDLQ